MTQKTLNGLLCTYKTYRFLQVPGKYLNDLKSYYFWLKLRNTFMILSRITTSIS